MATLRTVARTTQFSISRENILLNPSEAGVKVVTGYLSEDTYPGMAVVQDHANNKWIPLTSITASHKLMQIGIVLYKKRVNQTTGALKAISEAWDTSETEDKRVPICVSGICVCKIADQGTVLQCLQDLIAHSDCGTLTIQALAATGANSGTALRSISVATVADPVIDDDIYAIVGIGAFKGAIYNAQALNP